MFKYTNRQMGFTILELLVVIGIIGILAALALPKYTGVREDANSAVSKTNLKSLQTAIERYALDYGKYPDQFELLVSKGYVKHKTCLIPGTEEPYMFGRSTSDFIVYDSKYDVYATSDGVQADYTTYTGGITPSAQHL